MVPSAFLTSTWTLAGSVARALSKRHRGDDEEITKLVGVASQNRIDRIGRSQSDLSLEAGADELVVAGFFERL